MRTLSGMALILAGSLAGALVGSLALSGQADAARKHSRYSQPRHYYQPYAYPPRGHYYRAPQRGWSYERQVCEERAEAADPSGQYAGYPCWAREAFSPKGRR